MKVNFCALQLSNKTNSMPQIKQMLTKAKIMGADIALLPEFFDREYFCKTQEPKYFDLAFETKKSPLIKKMQEIAKELKLILPISFFEKENNFYFNSLAIIDEQGEILDVIRKTYIPDGAGYMEKFYFRPNPKPPRVVETSFGKFGFAICWDQWFVEHARNLAVLGAQAIFYPTAIGSEPQDHNLNSKNHWQNVMKGHASANMIPIIAANRYSKETTDNVTIDFYGSSFITDIYGDFSKKAGQNSDEILISTIDLDENNKKRREWGIFRDLKL